MAEPGLSKLAEPAPRQTRLWCIQQRGHSANESIAGLRRIRQQAQVIFYLHTQDQILIVRVLHHSMGLERHLLGWSKVE